MTGAQEKKERFRGAREVLIASLVYGAFLFLAVSGHYLHGRGLFQEVIWDPVGIFSIYTGDEFALRCLKSGDFPLWDHTRGLGSPNVVPVGGTIDYPLKLLAYLMDSAAGWELYLLLRLFLAGLFCFIFARSLPIGFYGSVLAGLGFMLCGYFREFLNLPDLNVALLMPLFGFFLVRFIRRRRIITALAAAVVIHFMDNSPESTAYAGVMMTFLFMSTAAVQAALDQEPVVRAAHKYLLIGLATIICIFLLNGDALFPFVEYYHRSWHFHPDVLGRLRIQTSSLIGLVTPVFDYWIVSLPNLDLEHLEQLTLVPGYLGAATIILAGVALLRPRHLPGFGIGIPVLAVVLAGIVFGIPPFHLILELPLVRYFQNFRYAQPFLAFAAAMLAGMGLELVLRDPRPRRDALVIAAATALWFLVHLFIFRREVAAARPVLLGLIAAVGVLAVIAGAAYFYWVRAPSRRRDVVGVSIILAAGLELAFYFNLAVPAFGPEAFQVKDSPAAEFIRRRSAGPVRVWGTDQRILHPNLAGLAGLSDLRDQSPLYTREYAELMAAVNGWQGEREIISNFLAEGRFYFDLEWDRVPPKLLDLLNVRYILAFRDPGSQAMVIKPESVRILASAFNYVTAAELEVGGTRRQGLILHAPSRLQVADGNTDGMHDRPRSLLMDFGLLPKAADCAKTDGVNLVLLLERGSQVRLGFARTFQVRSDDRWTSVRASLEPAETLVLASLPGPRDDQRCDYGAASLPVFQPDSGRTGPGHRLTKIYDREFQVFENPDAAPRAFFTPAGLPASNIKDLVKWTASSSDQAGAVPPWQVPDRDSSGVSDLVEGCGRLRFRVRSETPGWAVVSNLYYPGWRAWVNGGEARVERLGELLQGVAVPGGENEVFLAYVPVSYRIGLWLHLIFLLSMVAVAILFRRSPESAARLRRSHARLPHDPPR